MKTPANRQAFLFTALAIAAPVFELDCH